MNTIHVYIAGPYSTGDPVINTRNAVMAGDTVRGDDVAPYVPHLSMFWHFLSPWTYKEWLRLDFQWLRKCDVLIRLPGKSPGADDEVQEANRLGIPIYYSVATFLEALPMLRSSLASWA